MTCGLLLFSRKSICLLALGSPRAQEEGTLPITNDVLMLEERGSAQYPGSQVPTFAHGYSADIPRSVARDLN